MKRTLLSLLMAGASCTALANDWGDLPVPAHAGDGKTWQLHELSDNFNYNAPTTGKSNEFFTRWKEGFVNPWTGPGLTVWEPSHSSMSNGNLNITASRMPGTNKVYAGSITSNDPLTYPLYVEINAKISDLVLASDAWLLSADSTQEIDILEAYGSSRPGQEWFAQRIHLSHHVFVRNPFQDYQPSDNDEFSYAGDKDLTWYADGQGTTWNEEYHRIGVHWIDPWNLEYYIDGELVRVTRPEEIDPRGYTNGTGLNKPMHLIFNTEDQNWRSDAGITPTDAELADPSKNTYKVDWVRIYKPVEDNSSSPSPSPSPSVAPSPSVPSGDTTVIELGNFVDTGKQGSAISGDTVLGFNASGDNINYNSVGDWAEYQINLAESGQYSLELLAASPVNGGLGADISIDGSLVGTIAVTTTGGWNNYQANNLNNSLELSAGQHTIRVQSSGSSAWQWNADELRLMRTGDISTPTPIPSLSPSPEPSPSTPPTGTPVSVTVEAEDFSNESGLSTQTWWGSTTFLGNNQTGDWAEYSINFPVSGSYNLSFFASTNVNNGANVTVYIDGIEVAQSPVTGETWNVFTEQVVASDLSISAGTHTVKVESTGPEFIWQWYLDKMTFSTN
ncbi:carbohydrate-binding protein [Agaribacterium sp. ZY112]|uniref:carbohydrate-binding protein n=1 Tax=Agaribacterium sp. ZY112 TaxID=3233574 RepID=UPI0035248E12